MRQYRESAPLCHHHSSAAGAIPPRVDPQAVSRAVPLARPFRRKFPFNGRASALGRIDPGRTRPRYRQLDQMSAHRVTPSPARERGPGGEVVLRGGRGVRL